VKQLFKLLARSGWELHWPNCVCVCDWHIFSEPSFHLTFLQRYLASTDTPKATRRQYPALGRYRTLSATTNPTRKNRLEAGRKGTTSRTNDIATSLGSGQKTPFVHLSM